MSKVKIQGNASGTGIFTVAAPATNTDRTITLPDVDATVLTTVGGTITGRTIVKDDVNNDKSYPFAIQNQSQQPWWLRAEATSNRFAIHLNGLGNVIQGDSNGRVTLPYQPAFYATSGPTQSGVSYIIQFTNAILNRGSHYSTSTFRFTAPIAGVYAFSFDGMCDNNEYMRYSIAVNGSNVGDTRFASNQIYHRFCSSWVLQLSANDYVTIIGGINDDGNIHADYRGFSGYLLG